MKSETDIVVDELIEEMGLRMAEEYEQLAAETEAAADVWEDGPDAARKVAVELRRRAIRMRNA